MVLVTNKTKSKGSSGFSGFSGFGQNRPATLDVNNPDHLLLLAEQEGGAVAERARELLHPETSILSTIGEGLKNAFSTFVDVISFTSEVTAGILSQDLTISEALEQDVMPSDVLWGEMDKDATTMEKVGNFVVRTATDIVLDPLTWVTFGTGVGVFGMRATSKISLGAKAAKEIGKDPGAARAVSRYGQDVFKFLKTVENQDDWVSFMKNISKQADGTALIDAVKKGKGVFGLAKKELDDLLRITTDSALDMDFTKKAMSNLLEKFPQLSQQILDKGGIKVFGKSILAGQKIRAIKSLIPGMQTVDRFMTGVTNPVRALFDTSLTKVDDQYIRIPQEFLDIENAAKNLQASRIGGKVRDMKNIIKANKLNGNEFDFVRNAVGLRRVPADPKLANAYYQMRGFGGDDLKFLRRSGIRVSEIDNHFPHITVKNNTKQIPFKMPPMDETGATKMATLAKFEEVKKGFVADELMKDLTTLNIKNGDTLVKSLKNQTTISEGVLEIGKRIDSEVRTIAKNTDEPLSKILKRPEIQDLKKLQEKAINLKDRTSLKTFVGRADDLGLEAVEGELGTFISRKGDNLFKRTRATIQDLQDAGFDNFDPNLVTAYTKRMIENTRAGVGKRFMKDVANTFGAFADEAPEGYVKLNSQRIMKEAGKMARFNADEFVNSVVGKNGEDIVFHPAIAKRMEEVLGRAVKDPSSEGFWRAYDKLQGYWKASVTTIFPAFHGRNAISNVFLNLMDLGVHSFNPRVNAMSADVIFKDRQANRLSKIAAGTGKKADDAMYKLNDLLTKEVFTDSTGHKWTFGELRNTIKQRGVGLRDDIVGALDTRKVGDDFLQAVAETRTVKGGVKKALPISQDFFAFKYGREVGQTIEDHARITNFVANLRNTGDVTMAAQRTNQFLFDYASLTPFEKNVMRRIIPFYSFTRKNLELQAKSLLKTPGRVAAEVKAITTIGDVISGQKLTDEQRGLLPDWIKDGITFLANKRGETVEVLSSLGTPLEQPFQQFQPNTMLGSISPLLRVPIEQATGYDMFRGKMMQDVTNAAAFKKAPQVIKDFVGFQTVKYEDENGKKKEWYVSMRPNRMHLILNLPAAGRVLTSLKQIQRANKGKALKLLDSTIGVRSYEFDLTKQAKNQEKQMVKDLQRLLDDAGVVATFERAFIPSED